MHALTQATLVDSNVHVGLAPRHDVGNDLKIDIRSVNFWYGEKHALKDINLKIYSREVMAFIGPSGCGKTTLLRCLNRSNDIVAGVRLSGSILLDGDDIHNPSFDPPTMRRRFGWIAQKPNPFPWSVYENVAYGPRLHGKVRRKADANILVERCLRQAGLWDEVKDRLRQSVNRR